MLFVPPWVRVHDDITWFMFAVEDYKVDSQEFLGYRPIVASGWPKNTFHELHTGDLGKVRFKRDQYVVMASVLLAQVVVVGALSLAAVWLLRRSPQQIEKAAGAK